MEQGKLDIDDLVSSYVPEVKGSAYESVRVRQLLDMGSGINDDDASPEYCRAMGLYPLKLDEEPTDLHTYMPTIQSSLTAPVDSNTSPPTPTSWVGSLNEPRAKNLQKCSANLFCIRWELKAALMLL